MPPDNIRSVFILNTKLLTINLNFASSVRSFSELKIIQNYLRSIMLQNRLCSLAILVIKKEPVSTFD
ncbi:hypothetical protein J437_LFUL003711 [Ladona fulva]|uniref:Uncharacterized protein n=1 Tax=Ladona fulva TaxID=123851 RepID=A0A8K0JWS5_LADFU|nr:hypothetical protein J437_LFUL003711 [Ladona fulva]